MCHLRNIAICDYQESVTDGQTHGQTDRQTDAGQSDPYVPLYFAGDKTINHDDERYIEINMRKHSKLRHDRLSNS